MTTKITATVSSDYKVTVSADKPIVSGGVESVELEATLCSELQACDTVYAVYYNDSLTKPIRRAYPDNTDVPHDAIAEPGNLVIGFVGYDEDGVQRIPTLLATKSLRVSPGAEDGIDGRDVTPDDLTRILNLVESLEDGESERQATFETNEATRSSTFTTNEATRTSTFNANEAARTSAHTANEAAHQSAFEHAQDLRQADYASKEAARQSGYESAMTTYSTTFYQNETSRYAQSAGAVMAANEAAAVANAAATAASRVNATISGTTLTVTDRNGTSTSVNTKGATGAAGRDGRDGVDGTNGADGADGYSPQAVVEQTANGATIYITDADGTTTASISNGTTPTIDPHAITLQGMTQGAAWTATEQAAARGRIGIVGKHELLESITLTENATNVIRQATPSGKNYDLRNIHAVITTPANSGATAGNLYGYCNNILCFYNNMAAIQPDQSRIAIIDIDFNGGFMFGGCLVGTKNSMTTAPKGNTYIASGTTLSEKDSICKLSICSTTTIPAGTTIDIYGVWA